MKKLLALVVALVLVLGMSAALAEGEDNSLAAIQEKGQLIMGLDDTFPPMGYRDENNEIVGFDVDLAREVCARLGVELVLQPIDWAAKELELSSGNIDCIWNGMSITPERLESMALTDAYMNNRIVMLVNGDAYNTREDLAGKVIAVQSGSFAEVVMGYDEYVDYFGGMAEILPHGEYLSAIMDMQNGNADAVLIDEVVANYNMTQIEGNTLRIIDSFEDDLFAVGFRKGDVALRDAVNALIAELKAEGKLTELSLKWLESDLTQVELAADAE